MKHKSAQLTTSPPARKPRGKHAPTLPSMLAGIQGGRARVWLFENAWLAPIALGWILASAGTSLPMEAGSEALPVMSAWLFGIGIGWVVREERGRR